MITRLSSAFAHSDDCWSSPTLLELTCTAARIHVANARVGRPRNSPLSCRSKVMTQPKHTRTHSSLHANSNCNQISGGWLRRRLTTNRVTTKREPDGKSNDPADGRLQGIRRALCKCCGRAVIENRQLVNEKPITRLSVWKQVGRRGKRENLNINKPSCGDTVSNSRARLFVHLNSCGVYAIRAVQNCQDSSAT